MHNMKLRNQATRFALRLPDKTRLALLPFAEKEDAEVARHLAAVHRTIGGDVEVPMTGAHLVVLAKVAAQHFDLPQAHNLVNAIANFVA